MNKHAKKDNNNSTNITGRIDIDIALLFQLVN